VAFLAERAYNARLVSFIVDHGLTPPAEEELASGGQPSARYYSASSEEEGPGSSPAAASPPGATGTAPTGQAALPARAPRNDQKQRRQQLLLQGEAARSLSPVSRVAASLSRATASILGSPGPRVPQVPRLSTHQQAAASGAGAATSIPPASGDQLPSDDERDARSFNPPVGRVAAALAAASARVLSPVLKAPRSHQPPAASGAGAGQSNNQQPGGDGSRGAGSSNPPGGRVAAALAAASARVLSPVLKAPKPAQEDRPPPAAAAGPMHGPGGAREGGAGQEQAAGAITGAGQQAGVGSGAAPEETPRRYPQRERRQPPAG
jgi:hypothetical protein